MANTRSAAKNARKAVKRHIGRVAVRSTLRTLQKKVVDAVAAKKTPEEIKEAMALACKRIAKAASNKMIPRRTASRRIGRLVRRVNKLQQATE